jgi:hypothetical protein
MRRERPTRAPLGLEANPSRSQFAFHGPGCSNHPTWGYRANNREGSKIVDEDKSGNMSGTCHGPAVHELSTECGLRIPQCAVHRFAEQP